MATFRSWLREQEKREDAIGWTARYWRDLDGTPKLSSPANMERHLEQRGLYESQEGLREAWDETMTVYRQQRLVQSAQDAGVTPEMMAQEPLPGMGAETAPGPAQIVAAATTAGVLAREAHDGPGVSLALLNAKLDAIMAALGITLAPLPGMPVPPIDWAAAWETADKEAV